MCHRILSYVLLLIPLVFPASVFLNSSKMYFSCCTRPPPQYQMHLTCVLGSGAARPVETITGKLVLLLILNNSRSLPVFCQFSFSLSLQVKTTFLHFIWRCFHNEINQCWVSSLESRSTVWRGCGGVWKRCQSVSQIPKFSMGWVHCCPPRWYLRSAEHALFDAISAISLKRTSNLLPKVGLLHEIGHGWNSLYFKVMWSHATHNY